MPYVYDFSNVDWPDEDDLPSPKPADFVFLPAPDIGGPKAPVRFDADGRFVGNRRRWFFGREDSTHGDIFAALLPCFNELGVANIYCRADGGNDEGFSWVSHAQLTNGEKIEVAELAASLAKTSAFTSEVRALVGANGRVSDQKVLQGVLDADLCSETWATWLLGDGFGTGEYYFYGAYVVDLVNRTIEEDPNAEPMDENIDIDMS